MNVTVSTHAGYTARRKPPSEAGPYTEDRHARFDVGEYHFLCVFDGHGGDETSSALARIVPDLARECFTSVETSVEAALLMLFERIDAEITAKSGITKSGSTCNVTVIHAPTRVMTVASLGDSPTLVYEAPASQEHKPRLVFRTKDQDCADEEEQARLRAHGLHVFEQRVVAPDGATHATGVFRCRTAGGTDTMTMSSFGDAAHDVPRGAVNKVPRVYPSQRLSDSAVVLVCSDGCMEHMAPFSHTLIKPSADARADEIAGHIGDYFRSGAHVGAHFSSEASGPSGPSGPTNPSGPSGAINPSKQSLAEYITERQIDSMAQARHRASASDYASDRAWVEREFDNQTVIAVYVL